MAKTRCLAMTGILFFGILVACCIPLKVLGQVENEAGNDEQRGIGPTSKQYIDQTKQRGIDELIESLSFQDGGSFGPVALAGRLSGFEVSAQMKSIVEDRRVRKLYQLLAKMPQEVAAEKVAKAYRQKLAAFQKSPTHKQAEIYGLHSTLFLAFKFCSRNEFNQMFDQWNGWYNQQIANKAYQKHGLPENVSDDVARFAYKISNQPELLMYLNLALMDQVEQGKGQPSQEFVAFLESLGFDTRYSSYTLVKLYPFDADLNSQSEAASWEPLDEIPVFQTWGGLRSTDSTARRKQVIHQIQDFLAPPAGALENIGRGLQGKMLDEAVALEKRRLALKKKLAHRMTGTRIRLIGPDVSRSASQQRLRHWRADASPDKAELLSALREIRANLPEGETSRWDDGVIELQKWISQLPESRVHAEDRKFFEWPKPEDPEKKSEYRIELEIIKTTALKGPMPELEEGGH